MQENFPYFSEEEKLKNENEFLKMKLMLEQGAEFGPVPEGGLDARTENDFLNYVAEFERQSANPVYIKVFERIGKPLHFKPAAEISDAEIETAWKALSAYLNQYNLNLDVCSPNISIRELYRFTIEELFEHQMDDMRIPGMTTCFIYDDFHPDAVYDNTRTAMEDCIGFILDKQPMEWLYNFSPKNLRLNTKYPLEPEEFRMLVNRFKLEYDALDLSSICNTGCAITGNECTVTGNYSLLTKTARESQIISNNWKVIFTRDEESDLWNIISVEIDGINAW